MMVTATDATAKRSQKIKSLERAAKVISVLAQHPYPMGVAEIATRLRMSPPSVHRVLATLAGVGWLEQNQRTSRYRLGIELLAIGAAGLITNPIVQHGKSYLHRLAEETGYGCFLSALVGGRIVYLAFARGTEGHDKIFEAGPSIAAHAQPDGKLLLAFLTKEQRRFLYEEPLRRYTDRTIVEPEDLEADLAGIRARGYAIDRGERFEHTWGLAVPVMGSDDKPILAMLATYRATDDAAHEEQLSERMMLIAQEMSEQLTVLGDIPKPGIPMAKLNLE